MEVDQPDLMDLRPFDVFVLRWSLNPFDEDVTRRAYLVLERDDVLPDEKDVAFVIVALANATPKPTTIHLSTVEGYRDRGMVELDAVFRSTDSVS